MNWHSIETERIFSALNTAKTGLSTDEASQRLKQHGKNRLSEKKEKPLFLIFLSEFNNLIAYLLFAAAFVSIAFKDYTEASAIFAVLLINAIIGFVMETQAIKSMNALKKYDRSLTRVWRNNKLLEINADELVPGDIIFLEAGDMVPADARLFETVQLEVNESPLTGESLPVIKNTNVLPENSVVADRRNMIYKGTAVTKGNSKAIVVATGMKTELGKISSMVQSAKEEELPLNKKLHSFSKKLIILALVIVIPFLVLGFKEGRDLRLIIETAIALAVAAIPEGLPIVATIALGRGMLQLAKHNVIVKKLSAVETLGSTNIIYTDKTGTLTENRLIVNTICLSGKIAEVSWDEKNHSVQYVPLLENNEKNNLEYLLTVASLCNNAVYNPGENEAGDPLEVALLKLCEYHKKGFIDEVNKKHPRIHEEPFSSETKMMGTIHKKNGEYLAFVKGAVEEVLSKSSAILLNEGTKDFPENQKMEWLNRTNELAKKGLRVLAFAYKPNADKSGDFMKELTFIGLTGFFDPPRKGVPEAISECHQAGIKVVMVTGDHPETAKNIALKIALTKDQNEKVVHGKELKTYEKLTADEKEELSKTLIFSRVSPAQKLDLIKLSKEKQLIVGMTGDGVNDAPALQKADIGIAMGKRGTQVAREAADMVLQDDSFSSIVIAIEYGRVVYANIRTFIIYLLSCNLSEIMVVALAGFTNLALPLQPLQILFLNLVTDVFPALALGVNKGSALVMKQKPNRPGEPLINRRHWTSIIAYSFSITASVFAVYIYCFSYKNFELVYCNNIAFFSLAFAQLLHPLNLASAKESFFKNEITLNPYLWLAIAFCSIILMLVYFISPFNTILSLYKLTSEMWILIAIGSTMQLVLIQLLKRFGIVD